MRISLSLVLMLVFVLNAAGVLHLGFVDRMENFAYDVRLNMTMPGTQDKRIVIVDIDERSLLEQGRWPWSRNRLATLVDKLFDDYKIRVLGFDVEAAAGNIRRIAPQARLIALSARSGEGMAGWYDFLRSRLPRA